MSTNSNIEWTDATWNPTVGCARASAGCDNCYAVRMTHRQECMSLAKTEAGKALDRSANYVGLTVLNGKGDRHFNGQVRTVHEALADPLGWRKPRRVFVNSMSDLFHKDVPFDFIDKVFAVMALTPQHTYQVLTKRPERMAEYLNTENRLETIAGCAFDLPRAIRGEKGTPRHGRYCDLLANAIHNEPGWPLPNVWLGTSVENQEAADERIPHLLRCPAAVRFLSCEPLLGAVSLARWTEEGLECAFCEAWAGCEDDCERSDETGADTSEDWYWHCPKCNEPTRHTPLDEILGESQGIHWVIVGGESGPGARPMHPDHPRSIRDQCVGAGVPFFFKQWGAYSADVEDPLLNQIQARYGRGRCSPELVRYFDGEGKLVPAGDGCTEPGMVSMYRVGKKSAGRQLDGREWNEMPEGVTV